MIDFAIVGAQKAGSSALHTALRTTSGCRIPRHEIPLFEDPFWGANLSHVIASLERRERRRVTDVFGIKRPDLLGRSEAPERLARHNPAMKVLVTLREPVARTVSAYYWYMQTGLTPVLPPEPGLERLLDQYEADGLVEPSRSEWPRESEILSYSMYAPALARYLQHFSREQMFICSDRHLTTKEGPDGVAGFLGLDRVNPLPRVENPGVYDLSLVRTLARRRRRIIRYGSVGASAGATERLIFSGQQLLASMVTRATMATRRGITSHGTPVLSDALRQRLAAILGPSVALFEQVDAGTVNGIVDLRGVAESS